MPKMTRMFRETEPLPTAPPALIPRTLGASDAAIGTVPIAHEQELDNRFEAKCLQYHLIMAGI